MHFKDDPISDMHAKNYLLILCLKHFPGPTKFGPVFWSRLFRRGPVEYNSPVFPLSILNTDSNHFLGMPVCDRNMSGTHIKPH